MIYLIPIALLAFTIAAFFILAGGNFRQFGWVQWVLRVVVALPLILSSIGHFMRAAMFASIIPPVFPHGEFLVLLTGVLEVAGAIGILWPAFARSAAVCLSILMIAIFPANVYAANQTIGGLHMPSVPVRTAMQVVYILLLLLAGWGIPRLSPKPQ